MTTTIQVTEDLQRALTNRKIHDSETYEEIIWDLMEDTMEINEETKKDIEKSREEIRQGKVHTLAEVKKKLCLK